MANFGCPGCNERFEGADALNKHHQEKPEHFHVRPQKGYKFVFRIRERYFNQIIAGTKTVEYRRDVEFWQKRIGTCLANIPRIFEFQSKEKPFTASFFSFDKVLAVFICGKRKHTREIVGIERIKTPEYFSDQGKKDVNTPTCLAFHLGEKRDDWVPVIAAGVVQINLTCPVDGEKLLMALSDPGNYIAVCAKCNYRTRVTIKPDGNVEAVKQ